MAFPGAGPARFPSSTGFPGVGVGPTGFPGVGPARFPSSGPIGIPGSRVPPPSFPAHGGGQNQTPPQ